MNNARNYALTGIKVPTIKGEGIRPVSHECEIILRGAACGALHDLPDSVRPQPDDLVVIADADEVPSPSM